MITATNRLIDGYPVYAYLRDRSLMWQRACNQLSMLDLGRVGVLL